MKNTLMLVSLILALGVSAHAAAGAPGASGGVKALARTIDSSGNELNIDSDKPWKVFAIEYQTTPAQIVDERGLVAKVGVVNRICMESAPAIAAANDWAILWDTSAAAAMTASGTGRRLAPPIQRVSGVSSCVDVRAIFTSGLGIMQGVSTGSTYVYWR